MLHVTSTIKEGERVEGGGEGVKGGRGITDPETRKETKKKDAAKKKLEDEEKAAKKKGEDKEAEAENVKRVEAREGRWLANEQ